MLLGRVLQEQLCELTRLVLKLPEVDGLLHRAGLRATVTKPEPAPVLEMFVKVTGVERMVEKAGVERYYMTIDSTLLSLTYFHTFLFFFFFICFNMGIRR